MNIDKYLDQLRDSLPRSWVIAQEPPLAMSRTAPDAVVQISAPDNKTARLAVEVKSRLSAQGAVAIGSQLKRSIRDLDLNGAIVFTRFVSRMGRNRLKEAGISYMDQTGNTWMSIEIPAVFIERQGADTDPNPPGIGLRSIKGPKAGRIVRGLCDSRPPIGIRELARRSGTNPGFTARVIALLEAEDVISRAANGKVVEVRWRDLLRRWSQDYSVYETNRASGYLAPRGLASLRKQIGSYPGEYALTGPFAVPAAAQIAPGSVLSCYVRAVETTAQYLDIRPVDAGVNVLLLEPFDELIFAGLREVGGLSAVALPQCAVDLLTGSGREPAQGEALMSWMSEHEDAWRS